MSAFMRTLALVSVVLFSTFSMGIAADNTEGGSLFGFGQGYFHPTVKVATEYSDNYRATADNEISDWKTTLSPGFWIAIPSTRDKAARVSSANATPGGQGVTSLQNPDFKGFQGSLMYNADIVRSHDHQDEDMTRHKGEGMLQYAFAGGLTLEASDVYIQSAEDYADTASGELEEFDSNLINLIAYYEYSPKLNLRVGYSNFSLDYTSGQNNNFKERTDDQISTYIFYRVLPKTRVFLQYDYVEQDYDYAKELNNEEQRIFIGLNFDSNARVTGHLKLGYSEIDVDTNSDTYDDFSGEASLGYKLSDTSQITLSAAQYVEVTDEDIYQNILHNEIGLAFAHRLSHKLGVVVNVGYNENEYRAATNLSGREDEETVAGLNMQYVLNDWLRLGAKYRYTDRESNVAREEYEENQLIFTASAAF